MKILVGVFLSLLVSGCCSPKVVTIPPKKIPEPELRTAKLGPWNSKAEIDRAYQLDLADYVGHVRALRCLLWPDEVPPPISQPVKEPLPTQK